RAPSRRTGGARARDARGDRGHAGQAPRTRASRRDPALVGGARRDVARAPARHRARARGISLRAGPARTRRRRRAPRSQGAPLLSEQARGARRRLVGRGGPMSPVSIVGGGAWGVALAAGAAKAGSDVLLYSRRPASNGSANV